jgi:23S rRNA (uracil1939-C5)-methyltransferase
MADAHDVTIARLGAQGDGIADRDGETVFVSGALPGETWRLGGSNGPECLTASPSRAVPPCQHYGTCGGCMSQHMTPELSASWKQGVVVQAFEHRGIKADVRPVMAIAAHSRRRAFLGVERKGSKVTIGLREEGQHTLVDLQECVVLDRMIVAAIPALREMAFVAMPDRKSGRLIVTKLDHGLDVSFDNGHAMLKPDERALLANMAAAAHIIRLSVAGDQIVTRFVPVLTVGIVAVDVPPAIFLQAVPEAEAAMIALVTGAVPKKAKRGIDLFSGLGTFTFPLARSLAMVAVDSDKRAIEALLIAARRASGLKPVDAKVRDLFRDPMSPKELDGFDFAVFDPPRAGAADQAERLARSQIPVIVAVSCAPATLARDARTLIDGGYTMGPVTPIDQFLYSPHIEAVAVFSRPKPRR